ncbi:MAG: glycerate kinase, partial [Planctomycetota bacterium]|nr:glycerate kinase [Planctomycetota bacterium]
ALRVRECLGKDLAGMSGAGAAGGLGFGLAAFVGAALRPGVDVVLDMVGIDAELEGAALAITAEGRIDFQTAFGKGPAGVGARAKRKGVPCLALAGGLLGDISNLHAIGIDACFSLCNAPMSLDEAMKNGAELLANATEQAFRAFLAGRR